jgi:hypothetical protein
MLYVTLGGLQAQYEVSSSNPGIGSRPKPFFEIRPSPIQGCGAFAPRRIRKGMRIIEYTGERLTPPAAEARYAMTAASIRTCSCSPWIDGRSLMREWGK